MSGSDAEGRRPFDRARRAAPALIGLLVFAVALAVLRHELRSLSWHQLTRDVLAVPTPRLLLALALTALNYATLTGYDFLALAYVGKRLARRRVAIASFLAYAIANNLGFAMLSGASIRYRFYSRWGVSNAELTRIVLAYSVTFWLGLLGLGGLSLLMTPLPSVAGLPARWVLVTGGMLMLLAVVAYLTAAIVRRAPLRLWRIEVPLPRPRLALAQVAVSCLDWALAAAALAALLPGAGSLFPRLLGAFLAAQLLGLVSHVPGGVGVFEGLMMILLKPAWSAAQLIPALVLFRAVYYLVPFVVALLMLVADELRLRRAEAARVGALLGRLTEMLTPRVLAAFTFLAGMVLLFSGATPAAPGRLSLLDRFLPLGVIEASHFLGSIAGAGLLLVSHGLWRRLDAAYYMAVAGGVLGIAASLLKGADFEEATLVALLLAVLWRARPAFDRRSAFFETRFSAGWTAAVVAAIASSVWLGLFAYKHVEYANEMWWRFELHAQSPRFLRASVGAAVVLLLFGVARLLRQAPHAAVRPSDADLSAAGDAIDGQASTVPYLVYLRDKALLFSEDRRGFVMYGVQGATWVALGDPVAPEATVPELIRSFLERCDDFGGVPVFYEVRKDGLHRYADFGLTFVKLGEEARVDLAGLELTGSRSGKLRQALRRLEREGASFRIVPAAGVAPLLEELERVSNDWLQEKAAAEKGFSLGFFEREYVTRFPVALVERDGAILAFATVWPGPGAVELSVDLMRYGREAPNQVMDGMFANLLCWGKAHGYRWFSMGMAPLSGFESSPVAPLWNRLGALLYTHGAAFYNFQGLRAYKQKFNPRWEPRYLAYPGGFKLPRILADLSALIAGGYRRIFLR